MYKVIKVGDHKGGRYSFPYKSWQPSSRANWKATPFPCVAPLHF